MLDDELKNEIEHEILSLKIDYVFISSHTNFGLLELKDKIWKILDVENEVGIRLSESRAMYPAASVSGW